MTGKPHTQFQNYIVLGAILALLAVAGFIFKKTFSDRSEDITCSLTMGMKMEPSLADLPGAEKGYARDQTAVAQYYQKQYELSQLKYLSAGAMHTGEKGNDPNYSSALKWYTKAAYQNDLRAQELLGNFYLSTGNAKEAYVWLLLVEEKTKRPLIPPCAASNDGLGEAASLLSPQEKVQARKRMRELDQKLKQH